MPQRQMWQRKIDCFFYVFNADRSEKLLRTVIGKSKKPLFKNVKKLPCSYKHSIGKLLYEEYLCL